MARLKVWCLIDANESGLFEIQKDDELDVLQSDDEAVRRARAEARKGRRHAIAAVAVHQRDKHGLRRYRREDA